MSNISAWAIAAGNNNSSPPNGAPEGMARSAVNDTMREMMAAVARDFKDRQGTLVTAGTGNAYTLTTNNANTALANIGILSFRADRANTGAVTLAVDGLAAKTLVKAGGAAFASGEIAANQLVTALYNPTLDRFEASFVPTEIPSGTKMLFQQTAAPTGWTKDTTHDNKALRVVSGVAGSAGTTPFTTVFGPRNITVGNLPVHGHGPGTLSTNSQGGTESGQIQLVRTGSAPAATGIFSIASNPGSEADEAGGNPGSRRNFAISFSWAHSHSVVSGATADTGSGSSMDFAVQYVDLIIATKA